MLIHYTGKKKKKKKKKKKISFVDPSGMADAIIGPLVGRLHELAVSEALTLVAVNKDIRRLRDKLVWLQALVREADARRRSDPNELTRVWLEQTRDAVFDAEDAVDHYHLRVDMSRYPSWSRAFLAFLAAFTTQVRVRHSLSNKIEDINTRLEDIIKNKDTYKIDEMAKTKPDTWKASTSISDAHKKLDDLHQPPILLKCPDKRKELEDKLFTRGESTFVIYVVGESGVGKTTLVREVYKRVKTKKYFDIQSMQSFAPHLNAYNIRQQIAQSLTEENQSCQRRQVNEKLEYALKDKRFLLVVDGEISSTDWTDIEGYLRQLGANKGSKVVRITQNEPEEECVSIRVEHLNKEDTKDLFQKRLLKIEATKQEEYKQYIENNREDIHRITEGLPLAIVLLSGLVQTKEFSSEWEMVFRRLKLKESKRVQCILSLCFDDLPHELKSCFLYFAALPANSMIEARTLVCMWMTEGFLRPQAGKTMEKVGYRYLNELVTRNLVNLVHMDETPAKRFLVVQNKVHDFLQYEAHEASFLEVHSGDDSPTLTSARRLSLQNYTDKYAALVSPMPKLRSIFSHFEHEPKEPAEEVQIRRNMCCPLGRCRVNSEQDNDIKAYIRGLLHGSEFLRVINLHGIEIGNTLPDGIGNVVHLQYLGITSCSLEKIPESIGRLTSLQTLDVRGTNVRRLPPVFWMIKTLRHVFGFVLKLPCEEMKQAGGFKHLYTLDSIEPDGNDIDWCTTLGEMRHLEYLCVWHIKKCHVDAFSRALNKLENLRTLSLKGGIIPASVFTGSSFRRLKFMVLKGVLSELPSHQKNIASFFPNLIMLSLEETTVSQDLISKLAKLPSLATLVLYTCPCNDQQLVIYSTDFRSLNKLKIDVKPFTTLYIKDKALPKLEELDHSDQVKIEANEHIRNMTTVVDFWKNNANAVP